MQQRASERARCVRGRRSPEPHSRKGPIGDVNARRKGMLSSARGAGLLACIGAFFEHTTDFARLVTPMSPERSDRVELPRLGPT
jgi:hypothetical protein